MEDGGRRRREGKSVKKQGREINGKEEGMDGKVD